MDGLPADYREDTNDGRGWLLVVEWYKPPYEGGETVNSHHYLTLGEARHKALHLGCASGIAAVKVTPADRPDYWVCRWDKREEQSRWHDEPFIAVFEHALTRRSMLEELHKRQRS